MEAHEHAIAHFYGMAKLSSALEKLPALVLDHQYSSESFGSWSLVLRYKGSVLRLDFDGRENQLEIRRTRDRKPPYHYESASLIDEGGHFGTLDAEAVEAICRFVTL
jgi:hypothetical protein